MTEKLKNIPAVIAYLDAAGWKVRKSAAYQHKKEGKLRPGDDGQFSVKAVDKYAERWLQRKDGSAPSIEALSVERAQAELEKTKAQARHWDTKTKIELGQYVPRDEWNRELAARANIFKSDIENLIRSESQALILLVEGNQDKAPELIDYYLKQVEVWIDRYTQKKAWRSEIKIED